MQVHDELVFEVYKPETAVVKQIVGDLLRTALPLDAPMAVETKTGDNWLAAHQEYTKKQETEKSNSCFHLVFC